MYSLLFFPFNLDSTSSITEEMLLLYEKRMYLLAQVTTIICGINILGLIAGFFEWNKDLKLSLIGITGNFLLIVVYLVLVVFRHLWVEEIYIG